VDLPTDGRLRDTGRKDQCARGDNPQEHACHHADPNASRIEKTVVRPRTPPSLHNPDCAGLIAANALTS
jgi:hypothetical protein